MTQWRFNKDVLVPGSTVGDVFPDVDKTVIYQRLLEFDIDAKKMMVRPREELGSVMAFSMPFYAGVSPREGILDIETSTLDKGYPGNEAKYIGLVHELAHALQSVRGEIEYGTSSVRKQWYELRHEQDAIRWSGKQAKRMGWSVKRLQRLFENRYQHHDQYWMQTVLREGKLGFKLDPRQETLALLQRRPVRVRQHRRSK